MKALITILIALFITVKSSAQGVESYCHTTSKGEYKIILTDYNNEKSVLFCLFNSSGTMQKAMAGEWSIRENTLIITWTGDNAGMPNLKFSCQRRSDNSIKALVDEVSQVWNNCTK